MNPLFNGTISFVQLVFNLNGSSSSLSAGDIDTAIAYATRAVQPIAKYASQYGATSISVNQSMLTYNVKNLTSKIFTEDNVKTWVKDVVNTNGLGTDTCVAFVIPLGFDLSGRYSRTKGTGGYHDNTGSNPFLLVYAEGTPFSVSDIGWFFAGNLSHEIAEMTVDPGSNGNPEVCDPCGPNYVSTYLAYFDQAGAYIETTQTPPYNVTGPYDFYINAIVRPAYALPQAAPADQCSYPPPGYAGSVGVLSFGVAITANKWETTDCQERFQFVGATISLSATIKNLNAPTPISGVTYQWSPPGNANVTTSTNGPSLGMVLNQAGIVNVTCTVTVTDALTTTKQSTSLTIRVLTEQEAGLWYGICKLKHLVLFIPQPIPIGDPWRERVEPIASQRLAQIRDVVHQIQLEAEAMQKHIGALSSRAVRN